MEEEREELLNEVGKGVDEVSDKASEGMLDSDDEMSGSEGEDETVDLVERMRREMEDEEDISKLSGHVWEDIKSSFWETRYVALFVSFLAFVVAMQFTVTPYRLPGAHRSHENLMTMEDMSVLRPILTEKQLSAIQLNTKHAETEFYLPGDGAARVKLRFHKTANHGGHFKAPGIFYDGVVYGLSATNSHDVLYSSTLTDDHHEEMESVLMELDPPPTAVMERSAQNNATGWEERGYAVYYSYKDLSEHRMLSGDKLQPWKRIEDVVLKAARAFKQVCVFRWHPNKFGDPSSSELTKTGRNRKDYTTIVQQVIPTRTGLNGLKSSVMVWASQVNGVDLAPEPRVVRKPWTPDDHWTHYMP